MMFTLDVKVPVELGCVTISAEVTAHKKGSVSCPKPSLESKLRFDGYFQYAITLMHKKVVGIHNVLELVLVCHQLSEIKAIGFYDIEQATHALFASGT